MALEKYTQEILEKINPIIESFSLELYELNFNFEFDNNVIQILVSKINSIDSIDFNIIENLSEKISQVFDQININEQYLLEVSSAGIERKIMSKQNLINLLPCYVYLELNEKVNNVSEFNASVESYKNDEFICKINFKGQIKNVKITWENIKFIRLAVKF